MGWNERDDNPWGIGSDSNIWSPDDDKPKPPPPTPEEEAQRAAWEAQCQAQWEAQQALREVGMAGEWVRGGCYKPTPLLEFDPLEGKGEIGGEGWFHVAVFEDATWAWYQIEEEPQAEGFLRDQMEKYLQAPPDQIDPGAPLSPKTFRRLMAAVGLKEE
ncbi:MAG: hypothetical protein WC291_02620 [Thermodesulfovibrionales bacterium]